MLTKTRTFARSLLKIRKAFVAVLIIVAIAAVWLKYGHDTRKPGIYLTGPLTSIKLGTKYTYQVEIVSSTGYKDATINFLVPSSNIRITKHVSLPARHAWKGTFTTKFLTTDSMSTKGLTVSVLVLPPHSGYEPLFYKAYPVKPLPHQNPIPSSHSTNPALSPTFGS